MTTKKGRNGGTLKSQEAGDPPLVGAGRKPNPFKQHIIMCADEERCLTVSGLLIVDNVITSELVTVSVSVPSALMVVQKMFKKAAKGDVSAARWLVETGFGRAVTLQNDSENPLGGGFAIILPNNSRPNQPI